MASKEVKVISEAPELRFIEYLNPLHLLRQLFRYRELLNQFMWWEVNDRYRGSVLGFLWPIIVPLLRLSVYTFVFSVLLGGKKVVWGVDSNLYVGAMIFCGFIVFNIFAETIGKSAHLMWSNTPYVKNIIFPLEIISVTAVGVAVIHTLIGMGVLVLIELFINGVIHWTIIYLPVLLIPLLLSVTGLSWMLATLGVFNRDVDNLMQSLIQILFLLSAVVFPLERLIQLFPTHWQWLVRLNIVSSVIEDTRRVVIKGLPPDWYWFSINTIASLMVMLTGYACFMYYKRQFADVV